MNRDAALAVLIGLLLLPLLLVPFLPQAEVGGPLSPLPARQLPYRTYVVRAGDTLAAVADRFGVPVAHLVASNDLADPSLLVPGQQLVLPDGGLLHTVREGQSLADIARTYGVTVAALQEANDLVDDPAPGRRLLVPEPRVVPQAAALSLGLGQGTRFIWPVRGRITSTFGPRVHPVFGTPDMHTGVDVGVAQGTSVHAAAPGAVKWTGPQGGYGQLVIVEHADGYSTYYAHLYRIVVSPGQYVEAGQVIALSGNTGISTGPHLHFEIRRFGEPIDPLPLLP
ncbi:MAG: LysM peptidoglycan-binding domain-containing M23 family metallopeptidase [Candidatus Bipolaricaulaceae bacterium]